MSDSLLTDCARNCTIVGMELVIDTSAIVAVLLNEPEKAAILERTDGVELVAPPSLHWEIGNAFSKMFRRRRTTLSRAEQAIAEYERINIRVVDVDLIQALELADQLGMYAYDAYMLACALNLRLPILTLDKKLYNAANLLGVRTVEVNQ